MKATQIKKIEINLFLEALLQRYGYDFSNYARASMKRRVMRVLAETGQKTVSEMIPDLLYDESFFAKCIREFSITVTEMFRNPDFYQAIIEKVVPYLKTFPYFKTWHAGCATGEEVYSFAIILKEEGLLDRATIFATDFNELAINKAKQGIYSIKDVKDFTVNYQAAGGKCSFSEYYHAGYDSIIIDQSLRKNITFAGHNLVSDQVFGEMNLIVCRNVLIYFNQTLQNRVFDLFNDSLRINGFLALGDKESLQLSGIEKNYKVIDSRWKIYQKIR